MKKWQYHNLCLPSFKEAKTLRHWHIEQGLPGLRCRQKHASVVLDKPGASQFTKIAAADSLSLAKMLASHVASTRPIVLFQRPCIAPFRPAVQAQVARVPVVCRAAAAEVVEADIDVAAPKGGIAHLRFKRGSVHKVRRVLDVMRGRSFEDAILMMEYMPYRACEEILKALKSAAANAKNNEGAQKSKLVVAECFADQGPILKRFRCRAQGRGFKIAKPTFHLTVRLEERE